MLGLEYRLTTESGLSLIPAGMDGNKSPARGNGESIAFGAGDYGHSPAIGQANMAFGHGAAPELW